MDPPSHESSDSPAEEIIYLFQHKLGALGTSKNSGVSDYADEGNDQYGSDIRGGSTEQKPPFASPVRRGLKAGLSPFHVVSFEIIDETALHSERRIRRYDDLEYVSSPSTNCRPSQVEGIPSFASQLDRKTEGYRSDSVASSPPTSDAAHTVAGGRDGSKDLRGSSTRSVKFRRTTTKSSRTALKPLTLDQLATDVELIGYVENQHVTKEGLEIEFFFANESDAASVYEYYQALAPRLGFEVSRRKQHPINGDKLDESLNRSKGPHTGMKRDRSPASEASSRANKRRLTSTSEGKIAGWHATEGPDASPHRTPTRNEYTHGLLGWQRRDRHPDEITSRPPANMEY